MTGEINMIKIELTPVDAENFKEYCRYQILFNTLLQSGVFNTHNGQVTLNFDPDGSLIDIKLATILYKKGKSVLK